MLTPKQLDIIKNILSSKLDPELYSVFIFGSRATGLDEEYSDIDLGIEGKPLDAKTKIELEEAFEESDLPFSVDLVDFSTVNNKFRQIAKQQIITL